MANEDKRIIELPASESILNDDWIGKDSASEGTTKIQLSFLKQLFGGNNFAGEWAANTAYSKDSYVTHDGKLYHNIDGASITQSTWNASAWEEITVSGELKKMAENFASTFNSNTSYHVGQFVVHNNTFYRCNTPHTGAWNWEHFSLTNVSDIVETIMRDFAPLFSTSTDYAVGDYVTYNLHLYVCTTAHPAGTWVNSHFTAVTTTGLINDVVIQLNNAIASEASARSNADSNLQSNIDNLSNETIHIDSDGKFFVYVEE